MLWSVELLPLPFGDELLQVVNVIDAIDCLDRERSGFAPTGAVELFAVIAHRVPESPLFEIPDELGIFTPGFANAGPSLRRTAELHELRGFAFSEARNTEEGARPLPRAF